MHTQTQTPLLPWHSCLESSGRTAVSLAQHVEGKSECVLTNQPSFPPRDTERCGGVRRSKGLCDLRNRCWKARRPETM
ncbi:hypothetical protein ATANTOWER_024026 [Ataeniobius toweri]|uniref:Uncharacterized protein n=1 Tax=Ataeniobius toweri TaxID=208326 RepID=A0ABU7BLH2_9TELE|nr:hypothetical protein [Ataeniobius toweri]